ncbi:MAG: hypothetical protein ABIU05_15570, partial [Nitrospirales bacterium]
YPRSEPVTENVSPPDDQAYINKAVEILDEMPIVPYETLDEIEVEQSPDKSKVNWDELHFALVKKAQRMGADALIHIQLKGTAEQKVLGATALKYLTPKEVLEIQQSNALEDAEKAYSESQKERLDEDLAPGIG